MNWLIRLTELVQDWNYLIHRNGWNAALPQIGKEIVSLPYRHIQYVVVARSLSEPLPEAQAKVALEFRPFQASDVNFVRRENLPSEARLCARRLERNQYGLVACLDGQVLGYAWGCTDTSLERVDLHFDPGDVLFVDAFTAPAARIKGVHTALLTARLRMFQEIGHKRAIAYIDIHNDPSLTVWRKMGAEVIAHIDFKRIGCWRRIRYN